MKTWILIPARKGRGKNRLLLNKWELYEYVFALAHTFYGNEMEKGNEDIQVIVSSNDPRIFAIAKDVGFTADPRPEEFCAAGMSIHEVCLRWIFPQYGMPDVLVLLQPTSPFCTLESVEWAISTLGNPLYSSAMTVQKVPHNFHILNQRAIKPMGIILKTPSMEFINPIQRSEQYNKQKKTQNWAFGSVVAVRPKAMTMTHGFFPPSTAYKPVSRFESLDVDSEEDIPMAEAVLSAGLVKVHL